MVVVVGFVVLGGWLVAIALIVRGVALFQGGAK
jgi:hypothetical protein